MYQINATIKGMVPSMHDRYPIEQMKPGKRTTKKKSAQDLEKEVARKCYIDNEGLYIPADNLRMMLIGNTFRKGAAEILGSYIESKKGTEYKNFAKACIWVLGPNSDSEKVHYLPLRKNYDVYKNTFVTSNKKRDVCHRPIVTIPWKLTFVVHVYDDNFESGKVKELFEVGGLRCGIGAYGPKFGRFTVDKWEVNK